MKTTLNIPDDLVRDLRKKAADTNRTLSDTLAETLRNGLSIRRTRRKPEKLPVFDCGKIFVNVADREQLYRAMEGK